jgi:hypothetical protein
MPEEERDLRFSHPTLDGISYDEFCGSDLAGGAPQINDEGCGSPVR